ncbi:hypothetical protein [Hubei sobemo-like virus 18]|uniref:hypothetical protein n=1 Tax=Hubei sobemo-like virus 18 TaxID=1923203 RepID=UPI00090A2E60|nr:hypothetical protein [Hubei sobemo-like virus 18]APG75642.1 hypothetical protein [Hubei sobemo-like virus 18]
MRTMIMQNFLDLHRDARWDLDEDFDSFEGFMRSLKRIDLSSNPGYPYMRGCTSNRQMLCYKNSDQFDPNKVSILWDIVRQKLNGSGADPIKLFVKPEPHKKSKIEEKRYRLISSVSLADQLVDHMLFGKMNDKLIASWPYLPSKVGWSFIGGGWKTMPKGGSWLAIDKSSWDWTVQLWLLDLVLQARYELCSTRGEVVDRWLKMASMRYRQLFKEPIFITSGGLLLKQKRHGVQKSGCVNTIADNSMMQSLLHIRVCLETKQSVGVLYSMGDDTLQQAPERQNDYLSVLSKYCIIKQADALVEFAGFRFDGMRVEPVYHGKHAFNLLHADPKVLSDLAKSYPLLYHRSSNRAWFRELFLDWHGEVPSIDYLDSIYDGFE